MLAFLVAVLPNLPGLAYSINAKTSISSGAKHLYTFDWLYGFVSSIIIYVTMSYIFPKKDSLSSTTIFGYDPEESESDLERRGEAISTGNEKGFGNIDGVDVVGATRKSGDNKETQ